MIVVSPSSLNPRSSLLHELNAYLRLLVIVKLRKHIHLDC